MILNCEPNNIQRPAETVVEAMVYEYDTIPKDTIIEVEIIKELKDRIGLQTTKINIYIE